MNQLNLNRALLRNNKENNGPLKNGGDYFRFAAFNPEPLQPSTSFIANTFSNAAEINQNLNNRIPFNLSGLKEFDDLSKLQLMDTEIPFTVKFKIQKGKHVKVWQCKACLKEFGHQYTLMRHLPTHTNERKFQCNICGKAFRQMSTLSQHKAIHSIERPYVCEVCEKNFNRVSTLISHRKTHTGVKSHRCHLCQKAFHQKGNLRNHIFTHTNERPYKCDDCGKGFNQMSNLVCHKAKSHLTFEKKRYSCQICGITFSKRSALRTHEQLMHKEKVLGVVDDQNGTTNAIFVEAIKTKAMQLALETNQIPFALLRPLKGIPALVKVLPSDNGKQMLVPATSEDLKKYGQFMITPKTSAPSAPSSEGENENVVGNTVQIKIPVVATVIQQSEEGGYMSMSVVSPGPNDQSKKQPNFQSPNPYILTPNNNETSSPEIDGFSPKDRQLFALLDSEQVDLIEGVKLSPEHQFDSTLFEEENSLSIPNADVFFNSGG